VRSIKDAPFQARKVPLHFRVVKELVRRGADIDLWDEDHHTPLCAAATQRHLSALRFFLEQYQARGGEELKRALSHPCRKEGKNHSLLGHVFSGCTMAESAPLDIIRYLVQGWGADIWGATEIRRKSTVGATVSQCLPLHDAVTYGDLAATTFFIEECGMPVNTSAGVLKFNPLHADCLSAEPEPEILPVVKYLVEEKGADVTLQT